MSHDTRAWFAEHSLAQYAARAVHAYLADLANEEHGYELWPSVRTIALKTRLSERTVQRALKTLVSDGYLGVLEHRPGFTTRYRFLMPDYPRQVVTPDNLSPTAGCQGRGDNPAVDAPDKLSPKPKEGRNRKGTKLSSDFDEFWDRYPKKVGEGEARVQFERALRRATFDEIMAGLDRYLVTLANQGTSLQHTKDPHGWLSKNRWKDPTIPPPRPPMSENARRLAASRERLERGLTAPFAQFGHKSRSVASTRGVIDVPSVVADREQPE
jgi:hypothetical protein